MNKAFWVLLASAFICTCSKGEEGRKAGEPCAFSTVNQDAGECEEGLVCLGYGTDSARSVECETTADCPFHANLNPECVAGSGKCGASHCASPCKSDQTCNEGFVPYEFHGECYCIPGTAGEAEVGDPCVAFVSGDDSGFYINKEAGFCKDDLHCLHLSNPEIACEVDGECHFHSRLNPDCASGKCGYSYCAAECDLSEQCPGGFEPIEIEGTCYCKPTVSGDAQADEACVVFHYAFDVWVNPEADFCKEDLYCYGGFISYPVGCNSLEDCDQTLNASHCIDGDCLGSYCTPYCAEEQQCGRPGYSSTTIIDDVCICNR